MQYLIVREDKRAITIEEQKLDTQARSMVFASTLAAERVDLYKEVYKDDPDWFDEEEQIEYTVPQSEGEVQEIMDYLRDWGLLSEEAQ